MRNQAVITFHPATSERWPDVETVFGPRGGPGGCWCMYWLRPHKEYEANKGEGNKRMLREMVEDDLRPGIIAYVDGVPAGWCALAPRADYPRLATSRILKPVDEKLVWSVVCFFIVKQFRGQGLSTKLLSAAAEYARENGAAILEGYPVEPKQPEMPTVFAWTGFASTFLQTGFKEVARRSESRPIMRIELQK